MKVLKYPCELCSSTAVALGRFDGVHLAHKAVIGAAAECAKEGLTPTVFTFCDNPGKPHGKLLTTEEEKQQFIKDCGAEVMINAAFDDVRHLSAEEFVQDVLSKKLKARRVFCGYNYRFAKNASADVKVLTELCEAEGITVTCIPEMTVGEEAVSSTNVRKHLDNGQADLARVILGRPYLLRGEVVHGNAIGRTIDTPTLNIDVPKEKYLPKFGVYAAIVRMEDKSYRAVANIGVKPTVGSDVPTVEAYLIEDSGDFYGADATLELIAFIRPERKFADMEELKKTIETDVDHAHMILANK